MGSLYRSLKPSLRPTGLRVGLTSKLLPESCKDRSWRYILRYSDDSRVLHREPLPAYFVSPSIKVSEHRLRFPVALTGRLNSYWVVEYAGAYLLMKAMISSLDPCFLYMEPIDPCESRIVDFFDRVLEIEGASVSRSGARISFCCD